MSAFEETVERQQRAATPTQSVFVMANAGAGKTRVLTNRVARLLLTGVEPQKILCLTFTKAAASEMAERLFEVLGEWALLDDGTLNADLKALEGSEATPRNEDELAKVRRLFARALETPGGLKIQTIHSFCESALRRFPIESDAPINFRILEDPAVQKLLDEATAEIVTSLDDSDELRHAFSVLRDLFNEGDMRALLQNGAKAGISYEAFIQHHQTTDKAVEKLAATLDVQPGQSVDDIQHAFIETIDDGFFRSAIDAVSTAGKNAIKFIDAPIKAYFSASTNEGRWQALTALFFTTTLTPRGSFGDAKSKKIAPTLDDDMKKMQARFQYSFERVKAQRIYETSRAYLKLIEAIRGHYQSLKAEMSALDFDDLIVKTQNLFSTQNNDWVMYKLDQGVDHILIDEAQDTSPAQWGVVEKLFDDFLSGDGARDVLRSFFAVGDLKQSIYSFQGADADLFREKEVDLGTRLSARTNFENIGLDLSFRTSEPVLKFVDAVFAEKAAAEGLGKDGPPSHRSNRMLENGRVELWPLAPLDDEVEENAWDAPVDAPPPHSPVDKLAERITDQITHWLSEKTLLPSQNRAICPGDILLLVQTRDRLFNEINRRLAQAGVPVAGADRMEMKNEAAVEDLLAAARVAVTPNDDLSLAEMLKGPLFGFDDDRDLFPLANPRPSGQSLWEALRKNAKQEPRWQNAVNVITQLQEIGARRGPYAFFMALLERPEIGGRQKFYERLTPSAGEAIDEFLRLALNFENANPRALALFLEWFKDNGGVIKREMEQADTAVRVMTVHGSKGLEANIVFLLDAHRLPNTNKVGPIHELGGADKLLALSQKKENDTTAIEKARERVQTESFEEYRRLFYVGATRARDWLFICGAESKKSRRQTREIPVEKAPWHMLAEHAFDRLGADVQSGDIPFWANSGEVVRFIETSQDKPAAAKKVTATSSSASEAPHWLFETAPVELGPPSLSPSRLADDVEADANGANATNDQSMLPHAPIPFAPNQQDRYFRGRLLHTLLEFLPDIAPDMRLEKAQTYLAKNAENIEQKEQERWCKEIFTVLNDPAFSPVFAPGSKAEVSIAGRLIGPSGENDTKEAPIISGQIDRLVVSADHVLVVDYKTNRPPPLKVEDTPPAYLAQMAAYRHVLQDIYKGLEIKSALLWTFDARLSILPNDLLDHAFARYLLKS